MSQKRMAALFFVVLVIVLVSLLYEPLLVQRGHLQHLLDKLLYGKADNGSYSSKPKQVESRSPFSEGSAPLLETVEEQTKAVHTLYRLLITDPPQYHCQDHRVIRNRIEGAWTFCKDEGFGLTPPCLIYSFGIGYDFAFDNALGNVGCEVFSFDPSMNMKDHRRSQQVMFYQTGLGGEDSDSFQPRLDSYVKQKTVWKIRTLKTLLSTLNHANRTIDILKIDIESSEWAVVRNMLDTGILRQVKQLLLEWHIFPKYPARQTFQRLIAVLTDLEKAGFKSFHKNPHPYNLLWHQLNLQSDVGYVNTRFMKH